MGQYWDNLLEQRRERRRQIAYDARTLHLSVRELCLKYAVSKEVVRQAFKAHRIDYKATRKKKLDTLSRLERQERRQSIALDIEAGMPIRDVLEKYNVSEELIRQACKEFNVKYPKIKKVQGLKKPTYKILADLLNTSDTYETIAMRHQTTRSSIGMIAKNAQDNGIIFPLRNGEQKCG